MIKILMIFFLLSFPFLFDFHVLMGTCSKLMAFRAGTDSAVSLIIPTYVLVSFYNIIYVDESSFVIKKTVSEKKRFKYDVLTE